MKVGGGRAWAKAGFRNALRSSGQASATAEKATATAGTKNDVATIAKYWRRVPRGTWAKAEAYEGCREKWGGGINAGL